VAVFNSGTDSAIRCFAERENTVFQSEFDRGSRFPALEASYLFVGDARNFSAESATRKREDVSSKTALLSSALAISPSIALRLAPQGIRGRFSLTTTFAGDDTGASRTR
jgi:hypothetical protein